METKEKTITELLEEIIGAIDFDLIKIVYVDACNRLLQPLLHFDRSCGKMKRFYIF